MKLSDEQHKCMRDEMFDRMFENRLKVVYPSELELRKSPREFGRTVKHHKRNNKRKR